MIGSTKAGTLKLQDSSTALEIELDPGSTSWGKDALEAVRRGDVSGFSFGFKPVEQEFSKDFDYRYILKANLYEVSPVAEPAYSGSKAYARSQQNNKTEQIRNYFSASKESKQMTQEQTQKKLDRFNKWWLQDQEFKSLTPQLQAIRNRAEIMLDDPRLERSEGLITDDLEIQSDFSTKLFQAGNITELWTRALTIPIQMYSKITIPTWDEKSRVNGSILGGMNFDWVEESGTVDYSKPKFRALDMNLWKIMGLFPFTSELSEDAEAFERIMSDGSQKGLNYLIEDALIRGTGAGQPQGFLTSSCKIRVGKESGQDSGTVLAENIFKMLQRIVPECWTNGDLVWIGHPSTLPQVSALTQGIGTGGSVNPLWHWRQGDERHNKLCGIDYIISDRCSDLGTEGDIILVDLKSVVITYKPAQKVTSAHVGALFLTDEELFRLTMRLNAQNILSQPITPAQGSDSLSTVITLETR